MATYAILKDIQSRDPDGGTSEPTAADYLAHKRWAIALYGTAAWKEYITTSWDEPVRY